MYCFHKGASRSIENIDAAWLRASSYDMLYWLISSEMKIFSGLEGVRRMRKNNSDVTKNIVNRALASRRRRKFEPINRAPRRQSARAGGSACRIAALLIDPPELVSTDVIAATSAQQ